jgi:short-subunit dehydrogenase
MSLSKFKNIHTPTNIDKVKSTKFSLLLMGIGLYTLSKTTIFTLKWIWRNFFTNEQDLKLKYGNGWVIITGVYTDIGYGYIAEFISKGHKVCLIANDENKLKEKIDKIIEEYPTSRNMIKYILYDFNKHYTDNDYNELKTKIDETLGQEEISILLNNIEVYTTKSFKLLTNEQINAMLNVNISSNVFLMKIVLDKMEKREKRSLVITSGSMLSRMRFRGFAVYSGTKAFMEAYNECLAKEYNNIDFTYLEMGPIKTNMDNMNSIIHALPRETANEALKRVGRYKFITPHVKHDLIRTIYWNSWLIRKIVVINGDNLNNN